MDMATLKRKVKRLFGDEFGILIDDQDIVDWVNAAQLEIARETEIGLTTTLAAANALPALADRLIMVKRVLYGGIPLTYTSEDEIDDIYYQITTTGLPTHFYRTGFVINLVPTPMPADITQVTIVHSQVPAELALGATALTVPAAFHEDVAAYVMSMAYSKAENTRQADTFMTKFSNSLNQRKYEATKTEDKFAVIRDDPQDWMM